MPDRMNVNAVAVGAVATGLMFIWSGVKGASIVKTFGALVKGEKPAGQNEHTIGTPNPSSSGSSSDDSSSGDAGGTVAANKAIAKRLAAAYGWDSGSEWDSLVKLWQQESSWNNRAVNSSSGATGIPQALPASKLPKAGQSPEFNASAQISWGLKYIKGRYGDPNRAWAHEESSGWY